MILYYAVGGGLGHITRSSALIQQLNLPIEQILLLTNSPFACPPFIPQNLQVQTIPLHFQTNLNAYKTWLKQLIIQNKITEIYLDAFPLGILGEWAIFEEFSEIKFYYLARILNWQSYEPYLQNKLLFFEKTYLLEPLSEAHFTFTKQSSREIIPLKIQYPSHSISAKENSFLEYLKTQPTSYWLIIHSEPSSEIEEICTYAQMKAESQGLKPKFLLISTLSYPRKVQDSLISLNFYPPWLLFPWVDKIVSACGFNLMQQTEEFAEKHLFLPFSRRFDNQFLRAEQRKKK